MTITGPVADQPVRSAVSNPPFTRPVLVTVTITTEVEWVIDPAVPVTVTAYWPGATPKPAPMVRIPTLPAMTYGLSVSVGPAGDALADRLMLSTPLIAVVSIATCTLDPCAIATADWSAAMVKSGTGKTRIVISV